MKLFGAINFSRVFWGGGRDLHSNNVCVLANIFGGYIIVFKLLFGAAHDPSVTNMEALAEVVLSDFG